MLSIAHQSQCKYGLLWVQGLTDDGLACKEGQNEEAVDPSHRNVHMPRNGYLEPASSDQQ